MAKKSNCEALQQKVRGLEGEILEYRREKEALLVRQYHRSLIPTQ